MYVVHKVWPPGHILIIFFGWQSRADPEWGEGIVPPLQKKNYNIFNCYQWIISYWKILKYNIFWNLQLFLNINDNKKNEFKSPPWQNLG